MLKSKHIIALSLVACMHLNAQNLPSLLTEKNINATFSILAYDENAKEWGIAVATNNIYVGNSTIYIQPGLGAFSVIAETEPRYAFEGLKKLSEGKSIKDAILEVKDKDNGALYRQVSGIDAQGNVFAFTGNAIKYWKGQSGALLGTHYVIIGNQLEEKVLLHMAQGFENTAGTLAERLMASLLAGQEAGGQISGKQSAALVVKGAENEWFNQIDLRVDHSKKPIQELQTLLNYHYGRIRLNQSFFAQRSGNMERAKLKLKEASSLLEGWTGMYPRLARAEILMKNEDAAVAWVKKGLSENPNWKSFVPAFYVLRKHPEMKAILHTNTFDVKDWESALGLLSNLGQEMEVIAVGEELQKKKITSSYLNFILGRSYFYEKEDDKAIQYLNEALKMDEDNSEARQLLIKIKKVQKN